MSWAATLAAIDARLGPAPRAPSKADLAAWSLPEWSGPHPEAYERLVDAHAGLLREGRLTLGHVWVAPTGAFEPAGHNDLAALVYSFDAALITFPEILAQVASELFRFHHADEPKVDRNPTLRRLYTDHWQRTDPHYRRPVPSRLTGGPLVYSSSVLLFRRHLPGGSLARNAVPVLVGDDGDVLIVPSPLWPHAARAGW